MTFFPSLRWIPDSFAELFKLQARLIIGSHSTLLLGFIAPIVVLAFSGYADGRFVSGYITFTGLSVISINIVNGLIVMPQIFLRQRRSGMLKLYRVSPFGFTELFGAYWFVAFIMTVCAVAIGVLIGQVTEGFGQGGEFTPFAQAEFIPVYLAQTLIGQFVLVPLGFAVAGYFRSSIGTALGGAGIMLTMWLVPVLELALFAGKFITQIAATFTGGETDVSAECVVEFTNFVSNYYVGLSAFASDTLRTGIAASCNGFGPWHSLLILLGYGVFSLIVMRVVFRWN